MGSGEIILLQMGVCNVRVVVFYEWESRQTFALTAEQRWIWKENPMNKIELRKRTPEERAAYAEGFAAGYQKGL